jgi:HK97 family phage portal protein
MLLTRLLGGPAVRAATPENPRFSLNDPAAWDAFDGGAAAASGVRVNRATALTYSPWFRGVALLSRDVGKVPLYVLKRRPDGKGKARDPDHPAYRLLLRKPNPYMTAAAFREALTGHAVSGGNGYAAVERDGAGRPLALLPLDPDATWPVRAGGRLWYATKAGDHEAKLPAEDVLHLKGWTQDGILGVSVIDKAREALGLAVARQGWEAVYYKNNARPGVVIEVPARMDAKVKQEFRESWERMHTGLTGAHRTAILDSGAKASVLSFSAEASQLSESKALSVVDVANFLGVPASKLGDVRAVSYASLEQNNISYVTDGLDPWLHAWESESYDKLLTEGEKAADTHEVEFYRRALERADLAAKSNYNRAALGGRAWKTQNEAREDDGLDPIDDPAADEVLEPLNMGRGGADNQPTPGGPPKPGGPADAGVPTVYPVGEEPR